MKTTSPKRTMSAPTAAPASGVIAAERSAARSADMPLPVSTAVP